MKGLLFLLILGILVILVSILVEYAICHNLKKAVHDVLTFVKKLFWEIIQELFGNSNNFCYPVRFGADETGYIKPKLVDLYFDSLYGIFDKKGTYCANITEIYDIIEYDFAILLKDGKDIESLKEVIQRRLEKQLSESFKERGIFVSVIPYIDFAFDQENKPQYLFVQFAKTQVGVQILEEKKQLRRFAKISSEDSQPDDFTANWEDGETDGGRR